MNPLLAQDVWHTLALADGSRWEIAGGSAAAAAIVSQLGRVMRLPVTTGAGEAAHHGPRRRLLVQVDAHLPRPLIMFPRHRQMTAL